MGTAGASPGFTAKPTPTAGRKPSLAATIIPEGKPVRASETVLFDLVLMLVQEA